MNILQILKQLRDDIKVWVTNNLNALNAKIDEKTIPIDNELDENSVNPVQNKTIATEIADINNRVGNTSVATQISDAVKSIPKFSGDYNDLVNAPDIVEDEKGNIVIADELGNVIFKVDANGTHTTDLFLNDKAAATEEYVDNAVASIDIPEVDFTGYATEDFVTETVSTAKAELSETIVSEDDNWTIADSEGNIILAVNAEGIQTTALALNGKAVATEQWVEDKNYLTEHQDISGKSDVGHTHSIGDVEELREELTWMSEEIDNIHQKVVYIPIDYLSFNEDTLLFEECSCDYISGEDLFGLVVDNQTSIYITILDPNTIENYPNEVSAYVLSLDKINYHMECHDLAFSSVITRNGQQMRIFATFDTNDNITAGFEPISAEEVDLEGYATEDYVDTKVADLVNSAPEALDTLGELAAALENHEDTYDALLETIGNKATYDDLDVLKEELSQEIATESEELYITDGNGNIVFRADAEGIETTVVTAGQVIANGVDVGDEVANLFSELSMHTENLDIHVTLEEKEAWDNKSDFSGSYNDLTDKPEEVDLSDYYTKTEVDTAIENVEVDLTNYYTKEETDTALNNVKEELSEGVSSESEEFHIADEAGNIILTVDSTGAHTTELTLNGEIVATESYVNEAIAALDINSGGASIIDVTELPTGNFDTTATYRMLKGEFFMKFMKRGDSKCYVVEWDNVPTEPGESVFIVNEYGTFDTLGFTGYYNKTNSTVYGYFGADTVALLKEYVDYLDIDAALKAAIKLALNTVPAGWKTMDEILGLIGSAMSMDWGGVITEITAETMPEENNLYLLLSSDLFNYTNDGWVKSSGNGVGYVGQGMGSEIFNCLSNIAAGTAAHAEGHRTAAIGNASHSEGYETEASGTISHAEGDGTLASGMVAHAEGYHTQALGDYSHASGLDTVAVGQAQTVVGKYNRSNSDALFIVGNGTDNNNRNNAFVVNQNGTSIFDKKVTFNDGINVKNFYIQSGARAGVISDPKATVEGYDNIATGLYAHAEGFQVEATKDYTHAEGFGAKASGLNAHAEGYGTVASGEYSHAQGHSTTAAGPYSHAEGKNTTTLLAAGYAHVEGSRSEARANFTHAEGRHTIAASMYQHVQGRYNEVDEESMYAHIVGNGNSDDDRSNAHTVSWDGTAWFKGDIFIGGTHLNDGDAQQVATQDWVIEYINQVLLGGKW